MLVTNVGLIRFGVATPDHWTERPVIAQIHGYDAIVMDAPQEDILGGQAMIQDDFTLTTSDHEERQLAKAVFPVGTLIDIFREVGPRHSDIRRKPMTFDIYPPQTMPETELLPGISGRVKKLHGGFDTTGKLTGELEMEIEQYSVPERFYGVDGDDIRNVLAAHDDPASVDPATLAESQQYLTDAIHMAGADAESMFLMGARTTHRNGIDAPIFRQIYPKITGFLEGMLSKVLSALNAYTPPT